MGERSALLDGLLRLLPTHDARRQDEDLLVTELDGAHGAGMTGGSVLVGAVKDERRLLVGGQVARLEVVELDPRRAGDVALIEALTVVVIEDCELELAGLGVAHPSLELVDGELAEGLFLGLRRLAIARVRRLGARGSAGAEGRAEHAEEE